ncbi:hypothetical protein FSY45_19920 [Comamonas sp. Z1]|uniref:hypothetical protein n=1 Tax=Comamonas sp. Z1 TaxID=2601246 RepID=UPI000EBCCD6C|nr:hypothetical protein [Comamonas sp. Z1]RIK94015.1 MAG: hypothetical protein DCC73_05445 [Pseudomonadota bacterium]TYK74112.1 hypothetical protein FSY45_19920 [Comamonas sp. Z1]
MFEFSAADSLGSRPHSDIAQYLLDIGATEQAAPYLSGAVEAQGMGMPAQAYKPTGMVVGFIEATGNAGSEVAIAPAASLRADHDLIGKRIKITLDRFYVESYPGLGEHTVVCEFNGKNQVTPEAEALKFATQLRVRDKSAAAVMNAPVFLGLTVPPDGLAFEGRTYNIRSAGSDAILETLDSAVFRAGLSLLNTAQPALKPFVSLATGTMKLLANSGKNAQVHSFSLGLDFAERQTSISLRRGTYVVVQTDESDWDWSNYTWDLHAMRLNDRRLEPQNSIGYNYTAIGVSHFAA